MQNANITCDEPIKKACHQKEKDLTYLPTYLPTYPCLPTYFNLPNGWIKLKLIYNIFDGIYDYKPSRGCSHICHVLV
jgi:hypothetical protein